MARKSQRATQKERETVLAIIRGNPDLTHAELRREFRKRTGRPIAYVTLRIRLDELLLARAIVRSAAKWNPTYREVPEGKPQPAPEVPPLPISSEARAHLDLLAQPAARRQRVGYQVAFLDDYEPGKSFYLPAAIRSALTTMGRTAYAGQPAGTYARDIMQRLIIDLSWGSSRLEGNQYSRIDTLELLEAGRGAPGKSDRDRQMILNHKAAIEFLVEAADEIDFNRYTIFNLQALLAENLLESREEEGRLRRRAVNVGTSLYTPPEIPQLIEEKFDLILDKARRIADPIEQAFFAMVHLPYLQPFIDVNKRTSRLAANIPLIKRNLCPLSFVDVPEDLYTQGMLAIYEMNEVTLLRDVFAWAYQRSCEQFRVIREAMGEPNPIRLNYRLELRSLVSDIVRAGHWPTESEMHERAAGYGVALEDRDRFVQEGREDLRALRPSVLARYQLRLSEFTQWERQVLPFRR